MNYEACKQIINENINLTKTQKHMIINKCSIYCDKNLIKLVFDNTLIILNHIKGVIKLFIFENDYYILKEIEYMAVTNIYNIRLAIQIIIVDYTDQLYMSTTYYNVKDYYGYILLKENHDLIKIDKKDAKYCYQFKSVNDRENILAPLNEKINNVTIDSTLYQKLLDDLNINEILLDLLDSFGITINKFKFIE